jgi:hypothetical protein
MGLFTEDIQKTSVSLYIGKFEFKHNEYQI